jgi:hypothetical protein
MSKKDEISPEQISELRKKYKTELLVEIRNDLKQELKEELSKEAEIDQEAKMSNAELAKELVSIMSKELHLRVGIGPIWRQLNPTRKQEIVEKWEAESTGLLDKHR